MRSMLVIGLGRFGGNLAKKLTEIGNEVMAVDRDESAVNAVASGVTAAQIGDCCDEEVLRSLGVNNFDVCFVCTSNDLQSSLEITSLLKELGAARVVTKTDREIHAKFLRKVGADEIVNPERDMAWRTAMRFSTKNAFDYFELTPEYAIVEILVPEKWENKTIIEINVRSKYNVNVIAVKQNERVTPIVSADFMFEKGEHIFVAGGKTDIIRLTN